MASERSLYRKIQVVLSLAKAVDIGSISELYTAVAAQRPPNFLTKQYDSAHDELTLDVSKRGVRRAVNICRRLGLLDEAGGLTETGKQALKAAHFDRIVSNQIRTLFRERGIGRSALNEIIRKCLRSDPVTMPTTSELWERTNSEISLMLFSQMLTLLSQCGEAQSFQRKIYTEINF